VLAVLAGLPTSALATNVPSGTTYSANATWSRAGSPWIVNCGFTVNPGVTLTIEAGAVVKFKTTCQNQIKGTLQASGTPSLRITFTSIKDDSVAGDDGGDGASVPARGDWGVLKITGSATIEYADVRYGSYISPGPYTGSLSAQIPLSAIYVAPGGQLTLDHANVTDNRQNGLGVYNGTAHVTNSLFARSYHAVATEDATLTMDRSTVRDNDGYALWFRPATSTAWSGPEINRSDIMRNARKGIYILTSLSPTPPTVALPHGNQNNIYDNNWDPGTDNDSWGTEFYGGYIGPDWKGNFWGRDVEFEPSASQCAMDYPGRLLMGNGPRSPLPQSSTVVWITSSTYVRCWRNGPKVLDGEFEHHRIDNGAYDDPSDVSYRDALARYAPILHYDSDENFHVLSPGALTDYYQELFPLAGSSSLKDGVGPFADAHPAVADDPDLDLDLLRLDYLGGLYPTGGDSRRAGTQASSGDFVSARGSEEDDFYTGDSMTMEGQDGYPGKVMDRLVYGSDGRLWLQYWLFYYDQPRVPDEDNPFAEPHEGDWEWIQVRLTPSLTADLAAYSQHGEGQYCDWADVDRDGDRPEVWIARYTHANYFSDGSDPDSFPPLPTGTPPRPDTYPWDRADGGGGTLTTPNLHRIDDASPAWVAWPGQWGDSDGSPTGPRFQDQTDPGRRPWADPSAWADARAPC
jgi:hypothetical protein